MVKENVQFVKKVWGREEILVNNDKYCCKFLHIDKGAICSIHYHKNKQETFVGLVGQTSLTIEGKDYMMNAYSRPKTILPGQKHTFMGLTEESVLLEVSTHDDPEDSYRLTKSQPSPEYVNAE